MDPEQHFRGGVTFGQEIKSYEIILLIYLYIGNSFIVKNQHNIFDIFDI